MSNSSERKSVISGLFWKFGEILCTDGVGFIVSTILARLLLPEQYGQIAMVNVFVVLSNVFVVNGLGTALIQKKNADNLDFSSSLYFNLLLSVAIYGILYVTAPYVAAFYNDAQLTLILRILGLKILPAGISSVQNAYISRNMLFKKLFVVNMVSALSSGALGLWMAYNGWGVWALVGQILMCTVASVIATAVTIRWKPQLQFSWQRMRGLIQYGWKILASSLIKTGYNELTDLLIGKLYTANDLAYHSRGKKYPALVVDAINSSISMVLFPAMSKQQDTPEQVKAMVRRSIRTSTYLLLPLLFGLAALAEPVVSFLLTDKWLPCVPYLRICCMFYALEPVQTANLQAVRALGRSDIVLKLDIIKRGIGVALIAGLMWIGPIGVALAPLGMAFVAMAVNLRPNIRLINYSYKEQFADLLPNLALALSMAAVVYGVSALMALLQWHNLLIIALGVVIGAVYYVVLSIAFKHESFLYIWNLIRVKKAK